MGRHEVFARGTHTHTHTHTHTGAAWSEMKSALSSALGKEANQKIYALRYVDPTKEGKTRYLSKPMPIYLSKPIPIYLSKHLSKPTPIYLEICNLFLNPIQKGQNLDFFLLFLLSVAVLYVSIVCGLWWKDEECDPYIP